MGDCSDSMSMIRVKSSHGAPILEYGSISEAFRWVGISSRGLLTEATTGTNCSGGRFFFRPQEASLIEYGALPTISGRGWFFVELGRNHEVSSRSPPCITQRGSF